MVKKRRYSGKIIVRHDHYTADFFLGQRAKDPFWSCGNAEVALDVVDMLRDLGHVVDVVDESEEEE